MIEGLKPYGEYKESGLPWASSIPAHWVIKRGKSYLTCVDQRSATGKEELLTVSSAHGVIPRNTAKVTMFKAESYRGYKLCWPGDLVVNSLWAWAGGLGVAQHHGIISTAYSVYRGRESAQINPAYLHALIRSKPFHWELLVRSKGVWISRLQLTDTSFLDAPLPLPPPAEQAAIVKFLDHANHKIDRFIRTKKRLIALLNEQKQAIIHRAVTRGLNADVTFKDSGVAWLGEIPRHWEVSRLGRVTQLTTGFPFGSDGFTQKETGVRLLRGINVTPNGLRWDTVVRWQRTPNDGLDYFSLAIGDIVLGMDRPLIASGVRAASVTAEDTPSLLLQRVARLRSKPKLDGSFLLLLLKGKFFAQYIEPIFTGISVPHLSPNQIKDFMVLLPPVNEQQSIIKHVEQVTTPINTAITRTEREIALMQEYRTRLVSDVVTGKLDVRGAAAGLPDVLGDSEALVAADDVDDETLLDSEELNA